MLISQEQREIKIKMLISQEQRELLMSLTTFFIIFKRL